MPTLKFDLIDAPWIPCRMRADGSFLELGIREALLSAGEIREICHSSPLVTAALHRLLLAILHRVFGPADEAAWGSLRARGCFPTAPLEKYLAQWQSRFDLFDPKRPFYQCNDLSFEYVLPISKLVHELASGNNATLFDHTTDRTPHRLLPAEAARALVAHQSFAVGGLVSLEKGQNPKLYKSADGAPLAKGAVALVSGADLFETLMLNLNRYDPTDDAPFAMTGRDLPAWEQDKQPRAGDRVPSGYLDLLTWQSRRIRLQPEADGSVEKVVIMKGAQFPDSWLPRN